MGTWRLDLAYDGTPFCGWAKQPGRRSVEGELERALEVVVRERVRLSVAGRTDAGVHALAQVASFVTSRTGFVPERLRHSLNALLPPEVAVLAAAPAADDFDARGASGRTYRYRLWLPDVRPVFERGCVWDVRGRLDFDVLNEAAALLVGRRDFSALTPSARFYRTCVREVRAAAWDLGADGPEAVFTITGSSFLHTMVRVAVGTMVDVAQGRMTLDEMRSGIDSGRRQGLGGRRRRPAWRSSG